MNFVLTEKGIDCWCLGLCLRPNNFFAYYFLLPQTTWNCMFWRWLKNLSWMWLLNFCLTLGFQNGYTSSYWIGRPTERPHMLPCININYLRWCLLPLQGLNLESQHQSFGFHLKSINNIISFWGSASCWAHVGARTGQPIVNWTVSLFWGAGLDPFVLNKLKNVL